MSGTLRLRGSTSGYAELQAAAVAGDQTFILPAVGGTLLTTDSPVGNLTLELGSASQPSLRFEGDTDTGLFSSGANTLNLVTGGSNKLVLGATAHTIFSGANGAVRALDIDSSGRLLIGMTSAPAGTDAQYTKLAIRGNTINNNACYLSLGNGKSTADTTNDDNLGIITFNDSDTDAGEYARIIGASDGANGTNDYPGKLIFSTTPDGGSSPTLRMKINNAGYVGIGAFSSTDPTSLLHLKDTSSPSLRLQDTTNDCTLLMYAQNSNSHVGTSSDHALIFDTNSNPRFTLTAAGLALFGGHTSGSYQLEVVGTGNQTLLVGSTNATGAMLVLDGDSNGDGSGSDYASILHGSDANLEINNRKNASILFKTSSNETTRLVINTDGIVSIGTTGTAVGGAPGGTDGKLNIYTDTGSNTWATQIRHDHGSAGNGLFVRAAATSSNYTAYFTANNEAIVHLAVRGDGNVGVGTAAPLGVLHTSLNATDGVGIYLENRADAGASDAVGIDFTLRRSGGYQFAGTRIRGVKENAWTSTPSTINSAITFSTFNSETASEKMRLDSSGRLLVGLEEPVADGYVEVKAGTDRDNTIVAWGADTTSEYIAMGVSSDGPTITAGGASTTTSSLIFRTSNNGTEAERARITDANDGRFLVGTTGGGNASDPGIKITGGTGGTVDVVLNAATNINLNHVYNINATNNGYRYYLSADGGIRNFSSNNSNLCDEREKKNIATLEDKWDKVKSWQLKKFHYIGEQDTDALRYGVIAQQVETECPEVLTSWLKQEGREAELDDDGNVVTPAQEEILRKGVKEQQMMWMAIKALQEAMERIESLETRIATLENN